MSTSTVDALILSVASARWQKVAMVIAEVSRDGTFVAPDPDGEFDFIAERIAALVTSGQLEAQGDISKWRQSEVRLCS